jgi:hypothetical protein
MSSIALERNHPIQVSSHLRPADVGGIRVLGSARVILFDEIRYKIFVKQRFTIGRNQDCDIRIKDPTVSGEHCAISRPASGGFLLQDSAAKNGVYVHHPLDGGRTWRRVATHDVVAYEAKRVPGPGVDDGFQSIEGELHVSYFWYPHW